MKSQKKLHYWLITFMIFGFFVLALCKTSGAIAQEPERTELVRPTDIPTRTMRPTPTPQLTATPYPGPVETEDPNPYPGYIGPSAVDVISFDAKSVNVKVDIIALIALVVVGIVLIEKWRRQDD